MKTKSLIIFSFLILFIGLYSVSAQDFYLAPNGVTCMCPNAAIGDSGVVNGITYTKRTNVQITSQNAATTCTSGITDMQGLFSGNDLFNEDIESWDVSSVTNMKLMFFQNESFNRNIGYWDVSSVTNMEGMFWAGSAPQGIGNWDVSSVITMEGMFRQTFGSVDIGNWDVSNVITMERTFSETNFNEDISNWDVSSVTNMSLMFFTATSFNQDIGSWDVSNVTNMFSMFNLANQFNGDISNWDVSNVTDMGSMFSSSSNFNRNIGNWDVSNVTNMGGMFAYASDFNQDLSNWQFNSDVTLGSFLSEAGLDTNNYDLLLGSFSNQNLINKNLNAYGLTYCNNASREDLVTNKGWVITDDEFLTPSITAPDNLNINANSGSCVATGVDLGVPVIDAECGVNSITNNAPSEFPIGSTQVIWTLIDGGGNEVTDTQTVTVTFAVPVDIADICYVSSDDIEVTKNRIYLSNFDGANVNYYEVFRETSIGGVYESIGQITPPENSLLDNTSDNNSQNYQYRINTTDICEGTSADSPIHQTMLLQSSIATDNSVNLNWNPYLGITYSTYNIYRQINGGAYELLVSIPSSSSTYSDTQANVLTNFYKYYVSIDVSNCGGNPGNPSVSSNIKVVDPFNLSTNEWNDLSNLVKVFPNPARSSVSIELPETIALKEVKVLNKLGQVISKSENQFIETEYLNAGVYYLQIDTDMGLFYKSLIKE